jgi:hypothetical protein
MVVWELVLVLEREKGSEELVWRELRSYRARD